MLLCSATVIFNYRLWILPGSWPQSTLRIGVLLQRKNSPILLLPAPAGMIFPSVIYGQRARQQGIPCFAILDQWINFGLRFSAYGLNQKDIYEKEKTHPFLPDRILVMDEEARQEKIREGIDETAGAGQRSALFRPACCKGAARITSN
jgi:hypothetical protein